MKKSIMLLAFALMAVVAATAQPQLKLSTMRHDFGSILWNQPAKAVFQLTNSGSSDLVIEAVHPDCGCTLVDWTKEPISPGKEGQIEVTYDAALLGHFVKQLAVTTNESSVPFYLTVSGDVVLEKKDYSEKYAYRIGDLYLDADNVEFDDVRKGDLPFRTLTIFNAGRQSYKPELMHLPKYLRAVSEPAVIHPGKSGYLHVVLNSNLLRNMGLTQTNIYLSRFPGDRISEENELLCTATLLPDLEKLDQPGQPTATIQLDTTRLELGSFEDKAKLKGSVEIWNQGEATLRISDLQVYNPGISASLNKSSIKPGKKAVLKITVYADRHHFKGRRRVLLITNDPKHPKVTIDIHVKK